MDSNSRKRNGSLGSKDSAKKHLPQRSPRLPALLENSIPEYFALALARGSFGRTRLPVELRPWKSSVPLPEADICTGKTDSIPGNGPALSRTSLSRFGGNATQSVPPNETAREFHAKGEYGNYGALLVWSIAHFSPLPSLVPRFLNVYERETV
jgi:hypothetical protein